MQSSKLLAPERRRILRVLVVDSSVEDVRRVRDLLHATGEFVAHAAGTVHEAQALLDDGPFDIAVIDYGLWSERGAELVRFVRERHGDVAVVLLTNGENEREALPALKLGAHDFLSKQHLTDGEQLAARLLGAFQESRTLRRRDTMVRWLEREARTDHLTGLYNRHAFDDRLRDVCVAARKANSPVTLIMIDIAGTRTVNEVHGHDIGDDMIRRTAIGLSRCIRGADFAARIGGDDFGLIIPDADLDLGRLIARRIAHQLERLNADEWDQLIPVSVTFGVATGTNCDSAKLFAAAEEQLSGHKSVRPVVSMFRRRDESNGPYVA